jgi:hypothetical protein
VYWVQHTQQTCMPTYIQEGINSILYYLCAESTAKRPITDTAQSNCKYLHYRRKIIKIIINSINSVKIFHWEWKNKISIFTINKISVI